MAAAIIFPTVIANSIMGEPSLIDEQGYTTSQLNQEISQKSDPLRHTKSSWERKELEDELSHLGYQLSGK